MLKRWLIVPAKIVVVGSSNIDMVIKTERIPAAGETVLGGNFVMVPGGKGANQAVCAAKLGADVKFVARVGNDIFGETSLANFRSVGVDTQFIIKDPDAPSGVALIAVDKNGENAIVVAPGANSRLLPSDVDNARDAIANADVVVLQLEIPSETVEHTIKLSKSLGTAVVLNPAPLKPIAPKVIAGVDVIVPNQHEAAGLLGKQGEGENISAPDAARELMASGVGAVVITLGSKGAYVLSADAESHIEPYKVNAVDTTAAGDAFTASLACAIGEGANLIEAARFAAKVAAISVTRMGAQPSMPAREEVESYNFEN